MYLVLVCGIFALSAAPALGATTRNQLFAFGSLGSGAGQFQSPQNIAVDQSTGDVYVADTGNNRVDKFDASGNFLLAFGANVGGAGVNTCTSSCQAGTSGSAAGQFTTAEFVAVDNSGGASAGDVYVGDTGTNLVQKFDSSGNLVSSWGSGGQLDGSTAGAGSFASNGGIAGVTVDSSGALDVIAGSSELYQFGQDGSFTTDFSTPRGTCPNGLGVDSAGNLFKVNCDQSVEEITAANSDVGQVNYDSTNALAVDPASGDLYVAANDSPNGAISHYVFSSLGVVQQPDGSTCTFGSFSGCQTPTDRFSLSFNPAGIAVVSATGNVYLPDPNTGRVSVYGPALTIPDVSTGAASGVQPAGGTLNGTVNPDGLAVSDCHFDYGTTTSYGQSIPCDQSPASIGSGTSDVPVTATLTGLTPDTTYHFRLVAANANGSNPGQDQTFTTTGPPTVCSQAAQNLAQTSATLDAQLDPHGFDTTYHFEYGPTTSYGTNVPIPDGDAGAGSGCVDQTADISGLQSGATYHFRVVATNSQGTVNGNDQTFTTLPPAQITAVSASDLTATGATLNATINPTGLDTTYHFEYGTSSSYGTSVPVPDADIGSGSSDVPVTQQLTGLTPNTEYHYRVVATNSLGTATSPDHTFVYDTTGQGLPDNRAYEQVTPVNKNAALLGGIVFGIPPDVADDGSRVMWTSVQCFAGAGSCTATRNGDGNPYAFSRTSGGWTATSLEPPATEFSANTPLRVSADTGMAAFLMPTPPSGEDDFYVRSAAGQFTDVGPSSPPAGGPDAESVKNDEMTGDFSTIVWTTSDHFPFDPTTQGQNSVYEYAGVNQSQPLPVAVTGGRGSTDFIGVCGSDLPLSSEGRLAADGSIAYFDVNQCSTGSGANAGVAVPAYELFARVDGTLSDAHTVPISARSPADCTGGCASSPPGDANFEGASDDGQRAYFTSTQQLTDQASEDSASGDSAVGAGCSQATGANGCNLYLYDFSRPAGHELTAVSAGDTSGGGPRVQGVVAISSDGSHAYFVAQGVLTAAANGQGQVASDGADNLYLYDAATGTTTFVAALSPSDVGVWDGLPSPNLPTGRYANVTPDGRYLVFPSYAPLTPDDNNPDSSRQLFRYDAQSGQLIRISIGQRGFDDNGNASAVGCALTMCANDAVITAASQFSFRAGVVRRDPTMAHDGSRVFFTSPLALTPGALDRVQIGVNINNGNPLYAQNVYEWEQAGTGSCPAGESAGCVSLISDGHDASETASQSSVRLLGSDGTGDNVFFTTTDQLVPQDTDTEFDVYDARVGGGFPYTPPPAPCSGDVCQGTASAAPPPPTAATVTFFGSGNANPGSPPAKPRVLTRTVRGATFLVKVRVPGKGRITITGQGVKTVHKSVSKAGTYRLRVALTAKEKRLLKRRHKLRLRLRVGYGTATHVTFSITDKA